MAPLHETQSAVITSHRTPHSFFTPTHLSLRSTHPGSSDSGFTWQSRRARKGRYEAKPVHLHESADGGQGTPRTVLARIPHERLHLKPHLKADISFWLAVTFTFGSAVWVVNGFLVWFPILRPQLETTAFSYTAAATAFIGGSVFLVGAYLGVVEALDRGREIQFGTALGNVLHHRRSQTPTSTSLPPSMSEKPEATETDGGWIWWGKPMWHDMGYMAALVQMFAATIFWISTLTGLPGVIPGFYDDTDSITIVDVFFWTPQVIGGTGFIISSLILMVEVQKKWWLPNLTDIGWQIAFWNLIGAIGFTLCGALGYSSSSRAVYQSALSTWWGSWAFLIGSSIQCCEAIWRE